MSLCERRFLAREGGPPEKVEEESACGKVVPGKAAAAALRAAEGIGHPELGPGGRGPKGNSRALFMSCRLPGARTQRKKQNPLRSRSRWALAMASTPKSLKG